MTQEELMGRLRAVAEHLNAIEHARLDVVAPESGDAAVVVLMKGDHAAYAVAEVLQDLNGVWRAENYRGG